MNEASRIQELEAKLAFYEKQARKAAEKTAEIKGKYEKLAQENQELRANYQWLLEQLKLSKQKLYGASSEKIAEEYGQINLFNEAEMERPMVNREPTVTEITYTRHKRQKRNQKEMYGNLPVEEVICDLSEEERTCERCGEQMQFLRWESRKELKIIPAKISIVEYKTAVYVCKNCDRNGTEGSFREAQRIPAVMEKSIASPSLLSYIITQKFCNAQPLYRQEQNFHRMGVQISRQTMSNWMIQGAKLLQPLYEELHRELIHREVLHADETPLEVLQDPGKEGMSTRAYMWLYRSGKRDGKRAIVLYRYERGRSGSSAKEYLKGFRGYLHCDGYRGYNQVENVKLCRCWAHVRRYFLNAIEVQSDPKDMSTVGGECLQRIERLFAWEKGNEERSEEEIQEIREKQEKKEIEEFFAYCEGKKEEALPKSVLGKAIGYALNQKEELKTYLEDPRLELSNNAAERGIKPFVIGRKNWLFCNSASGAESSAILYSLIETAKENDINPYEYLNWVFEKLRYKTEAKGLLPEEYLKEKE